MPWLFSGKITCCLVFVGRTCFSQSTLFLLPAIIPLLAQSKNVGVLPDSSLSLFLIQPIIKSCQFSFHYKPCIITSHHFTITTHPRLQGASLVAQLVKNPPARQEVRVWALGWEDPLEKEMTTHSVFWPENSVDMGSQMDRTVGLSLLLHYRGSCLVAAFLCPLLPLQSLLPKSATETLQTLNQITSFPRLKSPNVFPLYSEPSLQFDFISCPLSLAL